MKHTDWNSLIKPLTKQYQEYCLLLLSSSLIKTKNKQILHLQLLTCQYSILEY